MRRIRHRLLALPMALAISLASASAASAAVDFTIAPGPVNPGQAITVTPTLTDAQLLLTEAVHFRFTANDADERVTNAAPFNAPVSFTYETAGTKTITMQVEFTLGEDEVQTHTVRINAAPTARIERSVEVPNVGQSVRFDAGTTTDDAALPNSAYEWDFDNNGSYEQVGLAVNRTFATPGDKTVRLRVTDTGGRADTATATVHVNRPPVASFLFSPRAPLVGDRVEFTSVSDDPDDPIALVEWDLDGDGQYDDARGNTAARTFTVAGNHVVRIRVRDTRGRTDTAAQTLIVGNPPAKKPKKLRPWPQIRIVGFAGGSRVRLDLLTVRNTQGNTVKVRCKGKGCPRKTAVSTRAATALVRVRWLERRLPAGTRLYVAVTRAGFIGRYERILLRRKKKPLRRTSCLYPGDPKPRKCP